MPQNIRIMLHKAYNLPILNYGTEQRNMSDDNDDA
jgi:hypothetical protein